MLVSFPATGPAPDMFCCKRIAALGSEWDTYDYDCDIWLCPLGDSIVV